MLIQIGGMNVLTDPVWSDVVSPVRFAGPRRWVPPAVAFEELPEIDVVLVSHNHYDHCDAPTIRRLAERCPAIQWFVPLGLAPLLRRFGATNIAELDWWESADAGALGITCTPAQHFSARGLFDRDKTLWCSWALAHGESRIYFGADSALHPEYARITEQCGAFRAVILPIGAYEPRWFMRPVHMNPEDAVQAYSALARSSEPVLIPIHWGTFKLTDEPMDEPPRRLRAAWEDSRFDPENLRIPQHGETITIW
jgi:N-acyl-phosphatidylethanolamine-hydrolysing phospholipase D